MKKTIVVLSLAALMLGGTSCATVFHGKKEHCMVKPGKGEPRRKIHVGAFIADLVLFWPALIVDYATGNMYKPCQPAPGK